MAARDDQRLAVGSCEGGDAFGGFLHFAGIAQLAEQVGDVVGVDQRGAAQVGVGKRAARCEVARHRAARGRWPVSASRRPRRSCRRSEEHTSELQSLMRISYAVFCLKKKKET